MNALKLTRKILKIGVNLATIFSTILVLFTLLEMKAERDAAYRPNIYIDSDTIKITTSAENDPDNVLGIILPVYNIGVGVAEDISISMEERSYLNMCQYTESLLGGKATSYGINKTEYVKTLRNGKQYTRKRENFIYRKNFLLQYSPNIKSTHDSRYLPGGYLVDMIGDIERVRRLVYKKTVLEEEELDIKYEDILIPDLKLNVRYKDIQGKKYDETITLHFNQQKYHSEKDLEEPIQVRVSTVGD